MKSDGRMARRNSAAPVLEGARRLAAWDRLEAMTCFSEIAAQSESDPVAARRPDGGQRAFVRILEQDRPARAVRVHPENAVMLDAPSLAIADQALARWRR